MTLAEQLAAQMKEGMREAAKVLGQDCTFPGCDNACIGVSCMDCARRLCRGHCYLSMAGSLTPKPICPSCVSDRHPEMFEPTSKSAAKEKEVKARK